MSPASQIGWERQESRQVVLSLWVVTPMGTNGPFHMGLLRPSGNTGIYIMIHNSSKLIWEGGVSTTGGRVLKGHSIKTTENHCSRERTTQ